MNKITGDVERVKYKSSLLYFRAEESESGINALRFGAGSAFRPTGLTPCGVGMSRFTNYRLQITEKIRGLFGFQLSTVNCKRSTVRGFTLVEMIVAVGLFAVVMLISVGALLSLVSANRKTQALHSVMNNLNIALDSMVRSIRMGSAYHCGEGNYAEARPCPSGDSILAFEAFGGGSGDPQDQWVYFYDEGTKRIYKSEDSGINAFAITAPTVSIDSLTFYVVGTEHGNGDTVQPKVVITIKGTAGAERIKTKTTFHIQATAVQRILDL